MINTFCKKPLWECTIRLAKVATGAEKADLVIQNAKLINVCTAEIIDDVSVAIADGRIALVGDASHCIGEGTRVIDAEGKYLAPAFMDGHIHIESSMLSVGEYAKAVLPHGTSAVFIDPHEICNVLGLDGVSYMMEDARRTPLKTMLTTPSCVPAVGSFEDTGAKIDPEDVALTMKYDFCVGLGEMMNFPGIVGANPHTHGIVSETLKAGKIPTGHYSLPETGAGLNAYIASGIRCCHESTRAEDALAKMRLGMYAMLREGSAWHDLHEVVKAITDKKVDSRYACLISDDTHPHTLIQHGHLDQRALRELRISMEELMSEIRQQGLSAPDQVECAIVEKNGKLTIVPKPGYAPVTAEQLNLDPAPDALSHIVLYNGSYSARGLALIGKNRAWLDRELKEKGLRACDLFCVTANENGDLFWLIKEEKQK